MLLRSLCEIEKFGNELGPPLGLPQKTIVNRLSERPVRRNKL